MRGRIAAIDVGSNSMRVAVIETDGHAALEVVQEARAVPRLIREVRASGRLSAESVAFIVDVLREFIAIARTARATDIVAVATSAVRDASNAAELVEAVRVQLGLALRVAPGEEEARLAFLGALHSLPVTDGVLVDVGGGSAEVVRFQERAPMALATLQLGAVRLTDEFLAGDRPSAAQLRALREHARREIARAELGRLARASQLVGTGGTVRNLAKIARARYGYPLPHLHGYVLSRKRLHELTGDLAGRSRAERLAVSGLNEDRADTIVAGALAMEAFLDALRADEIVVSGQGLREGMAIAHLGGELLAAPALREAAMHRALARFAPEWRETSMRRARLVARLAEAVALPEGEVTTLLPVAAALVDLGRDIDYYNRHRHTESLLQARGLDGFTHREQALVAALVRQANSERYDPLLYAPLVTEADRAPLARAGALLQLADQLEQRLPTGAFDFGATLDAGRGELRLVGELPTGWDPASMRKRFARAFGVRLVIEAAGGV